MGRLVDCQTVNRTLGYSWTLMTTGEHLAVKDRRRRDSRPPRRCGRHLKAS
jgi:hypothetical protein